MENQSIRNGKNYKQFLYIFLYIFFYTRLRLGPTLPAFQWKKTNSRSPYKHIEIDKHFFIWTHHP